MGIRSGGSNEAYRAWKVEAAEVNIATGTVERGAAGRVGADKTEYEELEDCEASKD